MSQYPYHRVVTTEWSCYGSTSHIAPPNSGCTSGLDQAGLDLEPAGRGPFCPRGSRVSAPAGRIQEGIRESAANCVLGFAAHAGWGETGDLGQ